MKFSRPDAALRAPRCSDKGGEQAAQDGAQAIAPVVAELDLGQTAVGVLGEVDGAVGAGERGLALPMRVLTALASH